MEVRVRNQIGDGCDVVRIGCQPRRGRPQGACEIGAAMRVTAYGLTFPRLVVFPRHISPIGPGNFQGSRSVTRFAPRRTASIRFVILSSVKRTEGPETINAPTITSSRLNTGAATLLISRCHSPFTTA